MNCSRQFYELDDNGDVKPNLLQLSQFNHRYRPYYTATKALFDSSTRREWPITAWSAPTINSNSKSPSLFLTAPFAACGECMSPVQLASLMCAACSANQSSPMSPSNLTMTGMAVVGLDIWMLASSILQDTNASFASAEQRTLVFVVEMKDKYLYAASRAIPELEFARFDSNFVSALAYPGDIGAVSTFLSQRSWLTGSYMFVDQSGDELLVQNTEYTRFVGIDWRIIAVAAFSSCAGGTFLAAPNATTCTSCSAGTFTPIASNMTASFRQCALCAPGSFASSAGAFQCTLCLANQFSGTLGAVSCSNCQRFSTSSPGSSKCTCDEGYYMNANKSACMPCASGADCGIGSGARRSVALLRSLPGHYRLVIENESDAAPLFFACPMSTACLGSASGACDTGYTGVLCGVCSGGYHKTSDGKTCIECASAPIGRIALYFAVLGVVAAGGFLIVQHVTISSEFQEAVVITISFAQVLGSVSSNSGTGARETRYPEFLSGLISTLKFTLFAFIEGANFSCAAPYNFLDSYWTQTGFVLCAIALIAVLHQVVVPAAFRHNPAWFGGDAHPVRDQLVRLCMFGMGVIYPSLSSISLAMFRCQTVGAHSYLSADLSIDCDSGAFRVAWIFNIVFVVLIVIGWPATLFFYLWRTKKALQSAHYVAADNLGETLKEAARRSILTLRELQKLVPLADTASPGLGSSAQVNTSVQGTTDVLLGLNYRRFHDDVLHHRKRASQSAHHASTSSPERAADNDGDLIDMHRLQTTAERFSQSVGFLFDSLRQSCMYWSITEMARQVFLIGCLRLFDPASSLKLVFPNIVSGIFLAAHLVYMPYVSRALNVLKGVQLCLICLTYQFTLLVQGAAESSDADLGTVMLGLVTVASIMCLVAPFVVSVALSRGWLSASAWDAFLSRLGGHGPLPFEEGVEPLSVACASASNIVPAAGSLLHVPAVGAPDSGSTAGIELQHTGASQRSRADINLPTVPSWMRNPITNARSAQSARDP